MYDIFVVDDRELAEEIVGTINREYDIDDSEFPYVNYNFFGLTGENMRDVAGLLRARIDSVDIRKDEKPFWPRYDGKTLDEVFDEDFFLGIKK